MKVNPFRGLERGEDLRTTVQVPDKVSKLGLSGGTAVAEMGIFLDSVTTSLIVQRLGTRLESNPFSRSILDTGTYLSLNTVFMLFLLLLSYLLYRYGSPRLVNGASLTLLLLGLVRGFLGVNNLLILSGLPPLI